MTPEQTAKDLLWKYLPVLEGWTDDQKTALAKKCAVIAVDEMLSLLEPFSRHEYGKILLPYYQQVKQILQTQ